MKRPPRMPHKGWSERVTRGRQQPKKNPLAELRETEAIRMRNLKPFNDLYSKTESEDVYLKIRGRLFDLFNEPDPHRFLQQFESFKANYAYFRFVFEPASQSARLAALDEFLQSAAFANPGNAKKITDELLQKHGSLNQ